MAGKGRSRSDISPIEDCHGKRSNSNSVPVDEVLSKVLDRIAYDKNICDHMVLKEDVNDSNKVYGRSVKDSSCCLIDGNDGSFINNPIELVVLVWRLMKMLSMADVEHVEDESIRKANKDRMGDVNGNYAFVFWGYSVASAVKADGSLNIESFAEKMRKRAEDRELQMKFVPRFISTQSDGTKRIAISVKDIKKGSEACALHLYGYFASTSMDYRVVNANLSRMWRVYGIVEIAKTSSSLFYFKFKNEEGMKAVLESGPWMINNVPLVLNVWEPGIWLEKVEPSTIPIWTKERCLKKAGKLDFTRVLVEVSATDVLPQTLEIEYLSISDRPGIVGKLDVKYQWKPPQCTHCKIFGHTYLAFKIRPRTDEEIAARVLKDALKVNKCDVKADNDGFVVVGKKNKIVGVQSNFKKNSNQYRNVNNTSQNRGFQSSGRSYAGNGRFNYGGRGLYQQDRNVGGGGFKNQSNSTQSKGYGGSVGSLQKGNLKSVNEVVPVQKKVDKKFDVVLKPPLNSKYNANFLPKVLVKGSGSSKPVDVVDENVSVKNSFQVFDDHDIVDKDECFLDSVDEEYRSIVWPKLKSEVEEVMRSGVYPSKPVRSNRSLSQLDYFYNNCPKYGMELYVEDDEDVESENEGMVVEMMSDIDCDLVPDLVSNASSCDDGTGIVIGWDPNAEFGRKAIWKDLIKHSLVVKDAPWALLGDFNVILEPSERSFGSFSISTVEFLPTVRSVWDEKIPRYAMFSLASKLKLLKKPFRKLKYSQGDLAEKVKALKVKLLKVQEDTVNDPFNTNMRIEEANILSAYVSTVKDESYSSSKDLKLLG
ncbi:RNA-directed DNA polymerase, eukaryota, reverse transcriptase zinc-binding domain protein [Tanacetum coccineum]